MRVVMIHTPFGDMWAAKDKYSDWRLNYENSTTKPKSSPALSTGPVTLDFSTKPK